MDAREMNGMAQEGFGISGVERTHWCWCKCWWNRSSQQHLGSASGTGTAPSHPHSAGMHSACTSSWNHNKLIKTRISIREAEVPHRGASHTSAMLYLKAECADVWTTASFPVTVSPTLLHSQCVS